MSRFYPAGQAANAEFAFHTWLGLYQDGYDAAKPILTGSGLLEESNTSGKNYHVSVPPLSLGDVVEEIDGNEWPASFIQQMEVTGAVIKHGPKGLTMTEDDLREDRIGTVNANVRALGRAKRLFADKKGAQALERGLTDTGFDTRPIFAANHFLDPVAAKGSQSNLFSLPLTPDNLLAVLSNFSKLQAENKDPVFVGMDLSYSLVVPTALQTDGEKVVDRMMITDTVGSVTNIAYKRAKLVVLPQLTDATRWYVAIDSLARKPLLRVVFQDMTDVRLGPESDLWKSKQMMKLYSYEKSHYRLVDWRLVATSKP
jgi:hypothetical protein